MRIRPKLEEGWSTLILLAAMILVSATAIAQADLIFGLHVIPSVGLIDRAGRHGIVKKPLYAPNCSPVCSHLRPVYCFLYGWHH